ncbi:MAG: hypothetical protein LJE85_10430 [Gammaproteobacteria bacterium]|nr:hypothetical protein [Gammaproteobacteria bacterium]
MQTATTHGVGQLIAILLSAAMLIAEPRWVHIVVLFNSFNMAVSMGCAMTVGYYCSSRGIEKLSHHHASLLGTHFGGILCNIIIICKAFELIR